MLLNSIILAISSSIDSLGIGITYGLKNTKISYIANVILFTTSILITTFSMWLGNFISNFFPTNITGYIGSIIIIFMGIFMTFQALKNPTYSDFDNSKKIDYKEALFLAIALSLDSFCIGIGSSIAGISSSLFPLFISTFQLLFLKIGNQIGKTLTNTKLFPDNTWSVIARNFINNNRTT